ncbi:SpvB/TcaC N-terminal domain-containing protein [Rhizobium ruizarguesonis]
MLYFFAGAATGRVRVFLALLQCFWLVQTSAAQADYQLPRSAADFPQQHNNPIEVAVDLKPNDVVSAYLEYDAQGPANSAEVRRRLNDKTSLGGFVRFSAIGSWSHVIDPVDPGELIAGRNNLEFLKNDFGQIPVISHVKLGLWAKGSDGKVKLTTFAAAENFLTASLAREMGSDLNATSRLSEAEPAEAPTLAIDYPEKGQYFGTRALVRGTVRGAAAGAVLLHVDGKPVFTSGGRFEVIVDRVDTGIARSPWTVNVAAELPDGGQVQRQISLFSARDEEDLSKPPTLTAMVEPGQPDQEVFGAHISVPSAAEPVQVRVSCQRKLETPGSAEFLNTTNGQCASYRIEKDSLSDLAVSLPAVMSNLPEGFDRADTKLVALNSGSSAWSIVPESYLDIPNERTVATLRDRSSVVIAGILKAPGREEGQPVAQTKDGLEKLTSGIDPLSGRVKLGAPEPNPFGSANLTFPMLLRPVRGGNQPRFSLSYNSLRGDGLAGEGWNLDVPTISVETKWGVPEYSGSVETDTYVYGDGELVGYDEQGRETPAAYRNNFINHSIPRGKYTFRLRSDNNFAEFRRHGDRPENYWWEVVYQNGNREYYGGDPHSRLVVDTSVRRDPSGRIHDWGITAALDSDGNSIVYDWTAPRTCSAELPASCQTSLVPQSIVYNEHYALKGASNQRRAGVTKINFGWSPWSGPNPPRVDRMISGRTGGLVEQGDLLKGIDITYVDAAGKTQTFATYDLKYQAPSPLNLQKSVLTSVSVSVPADDDCQYDVAGAPVAGCPQNHQEITFDYFSNSDPFRQTAGADGALGNRLSLGAFGLLKDYTGAALGSASLLGTNTSTDVGAGTYGGWSPNPQKQFSFGAKIGYVDRTTTGQSALVDVTGDGLPDMIMDGKGGLIVCPAERVSDRVVYPDAKCGPAHLTGGASPLILSEQANSFSFGGEVHLAPYLIFAGAYTSSRTSRSSYFADVDGNGLMDFVRDGVPLYNHGPDTDGLPIFAMTSDFVNAPSSVATISPVALTKLNETYSAARQRAQADQDKFRPTDVVQSWRAPFTGVIAVSGPILDTTKGPRPTPQTKILVERSRGLQTVRCAESGNIVPGGTLTWVTVTHVCDSEKAPEQASIAAISTQLSTASPLFVFVRKDDVLYFRENGGAEGGVDPGLADIHLIYATLWDAPNPSRAPNRLAMVQAVVAQAHAWKEADLNACLPSASSAQPLLPYCDEYGRSPYAFSLTADVVFSASAVDDAYIVPAKQAPGLTFSGTLTFPAGSQPVKVMLLTKAAPPSVSPSTHDQYQYLRGLLQEAVDLASPRGPADWKEAFAAFLPGSCAANPIFRVVGLSMRCVPDGSGGMTVVASFDKVPFTICPTGTCVAPTDTQVRLEVAPQFGVRTSEPYQGIVGALSAANRALQYTQLRWTVPPRIEYLSDPRPPADLSRSDVDPPTQTKMLDKIPQTVFLPALFRGRYFETRDASLIGPHDHGQVYQRNEIEEERAFLKAKNAAAGKDLFDDPVVGDEGYRLPGDVAKCHQPGGQCEYRISHVFFTDYPAYDEHAPPAMDFELRVFVNGKLQTLQYSGTVPRFACGVNPVYGYPSEHLERSVDCGLENSALILPDSQAPPKDVGIQFALNDGNRVRGRDLIYSFNAKPGDVLQVEALVRPEWNAQANIPDFVSDSRVHPWDKPAEHCNLNTHSPRQVELLVDVDVRADTCRTWLGLRSTEVRLGFEDGLGLADAQAHRRDFSRLFVPLKYSQEHYRIQRPAVFPSEHLKVVHPLISTDHRGWGRFAVRRPLSDTAPPYPQVQFPDKTPPNNRGAAEDVAVDCSSRDAAACSASSSIMKNAADKEEIFPLSATYWVQDESVVHSKAPSVRAAVAGSVAALAATCAGTGPIPVECFLGPDEDIWVALGQGLPATNPSPNTMAQNTGRLGPDDLVSMIPASNAGTPTGTSPFIPIPALYDESESLSARVALLSSITTTGESKTLYLDMNGDGYPDPILDGSVYPTAPTGIPRDQWLAHSPNSTVSAGQTRQNQSRQFDLSLNIGSGGVPTGAVFAPPTGEGYGGQAVGYDTARGVSTEGTTATTASKSSPDGAFGLSLGLSANYGVSFAPTDFVDVNGDGLPDAVSFDEPSYFPGGVSRPGSLAIRFNLGYGFSAPKSWPTPDTLSSENASGGLGPTLGYTDGNGGWSGGVSLTRTGSFSRKSLVDINGDGLADLVIPQAGKFNAYVNTGSGFATTPTVLSIDPNQWPFRDTAASESSTIDAGATVAIPVPCAPVLCFIIGNPGVRGGQTLGRNLIAMQDLDGDGLLDFASTPGFYQGYTSAGVPKFGFSSENGTQNFINPLGKQNKLRTVTNASGSQFHLDYELVGNEGADNPKGIWALSKVQMDDGFYPSLTADDGDDRLTIDVTYAKGKYDRYERAFLGFKELDPVESGSDCTIVTGKVQCAPPTSVLRKTRRTYLNDDIYVRGLLAHEEVQSPQVGSASTYHYRDFVYDIWAPVPNARSVLEECQGTEALSRDDDCLERVDNDRVSQAVLLQGDLWAQALPRRHISRLRMVREVTIEGSATHPVRSMVLYDYDEHGNVTTIADLGQIRNPGEAGTDSADDYRADLSYAAIPTGPAIALNPAPDANILDRVVRVRLEKGLYGAFSPDAILRLREATYTGQTGHVRTLCQYLKVTVKLGDSSPALPFCDSVDASWPPAAGANAFEAFKVLVAKAGLGPLDIVVDRSLAYDEFGNAQVSVSPFNAQGERIESYRCYRDDPFVMTVTSEMQVHLARNAAGYQLGGGTAKDDEGVCNYVGGPSPTGAMASFNWRSEIDERHGAVRKSIDINGNKLGFHRDNWGRVRTVVSDWGAPTSDHVVQPARAACQDLAGPDEDCSVLLHVDYSAFRSSAAPGELWRATTQKYVLEDLYAAGAAQDDKAAIWQSAFSDGNGKAIQVNQEASACLDRGRRPSTDDPGRSSGLPDLCKTEAPAIASGWHAYDGLGRSVKEFYPQPISNSGWTRPIDEIVTELYMPDVSSAPHARFRYDGMDRVTKIVLPDANRLSFKYRTILDPAQNLSRVQTIMVDARCGARAQDRDARGLIREVWEVQDRFFGPVESQAGSTTGSQRAKELARCERSPELALDIWMPDPDSAAARSAQLAVTRYQYDALGQLTIVVRPAGNDVIRAEYDLIGRRTRLGDPDRGDEVASYDPLGNLIGRDLVSVRAVAPRKIRYLYEANRLVGVRYDAAFSYLDVDYAYDDFPKDWTAWTTHKEVRDWLSQEAVGTCRNCKGRQVAIRDASGLSVKNFDVFGQVTDTFRSIVKSEDEIARFAFRNNYDTWGTLRSENVQDIMPEHPSPACINSRRPGDYLCDHKHSIFYSYDQSGNVAGLTLDNRDVAKLAYNEFGAKYAKWTGDGTITDYTYDEQDRRLNALDTTLWNGDPVIAATYSYGAGGNLLGYQNRAGNPLADGYLATFAFAYDAANRLKGVHDGQVTDRGTDLLMGFSESYAYDLRHRLTTKGTRQYSYPEFADNSDWKPVDAPQNVSWGTDKDPYQNRITQNYDAWGALESSINQSSGHSTEARRLEWDPESRLSSVQIERAQDTISNHYIYDHSGARVVKQEGVKVANPEGWLQIYAAPFFNKRWDGPAYIQLAAGSERIGTVAFTNTAQKTYNQTYYYQSELPNGSTTAVTTQVLRGEHEGALLERTAYLPFGKVAAAQSYRALHKEPFLRAPLYGFSGKERDLDTGYSYFGARYYDSTPAIWLSPDPMIGSYMDGAPNGGAFSPIALSAYAYANWSPMTNIDIDGKYVEIKFYTDTGRLIAKDTKTKQTVEGNFFSGKAGYYGVLDTVSWITNKDYDALPLGKYDVLRNRGTEGHSDPTQFFALEPQDKPYGDWKHNASGRGEFMLHHCGGGVSFGCVTAARGQSEMWDKLQKMINSTERGPAKFVDSDGRKVPVRNYGEMQVLGKDPKKPR